VTINILQPVPLKGQQQRGSCKTLLLAASLLSIPAFSQTPTATTKTWKFEVVSIHQNKNGGGEAYGLAQYGPTPDGWRMTNGTLSLAILTAYVPQDGGAAIYGGKQVLGEPEWTSTQRYDIDARIAEADRAEWQKPESQKAMLHAMLQQMLEERCKMVVHRDAKEFAVYFLLLTKNGPKFKATAPDDPHPGGLPVPGGGTVVTEDEAEGQQTMHFYSVSIGSLTPLLSNWEGRPVQDKTGLVGRYDFRLQRPALAAQPGSDSRPSISAVLDDLGLKLESTRAPVETLVIDHVEQPSEN
jgi:bla regulator protein BlaR1